MNATASQIANVDSNHVLRRMKLRRVKPVRTQEDALSREQTAGTFSATGHGPVPIIAEPGLVIHVHAGCLWVPHHEDHCSVGVGPGECFVVRQGGRITTLATTGTQIELEWPTETASAPNTH